MEPRKRISLILAITLVASLLTIIATTLGKARDNPPGVMRVKVLRRKDQLHIKPRPEEIAAYLHERLGISSHSLLLVTHVVDGNRVQPEVIFRAI